MLDMEAFPGPRLQIFLSGRKQKIEGKELGKGRRQKEKRKKVGSY